MIDSDTLTLRPQLSSVATVYESINVVGSNDATDILSANASFPLKLGRGKHFDLTFQGEGNVIISRAEEESEDSTVTFLLSLLGPVRRLKGSRCCLENTLTLSLLL